MSGIGEIGNVSNDGCLEGEVESKRRGGSQTTAICQWQRATAAQNHTAGMLTQWYSVVSLVTCFKIEFNQFD